MFPQSVLLRCFYQPLMGELSTCLLTLPWILCPRATIKLEELAKKKGVGSIRWGFEFLFASVACPRKAGPQRLELEGSALHV